MNDLPAGSSAGPTLALPSGTAADELRQSDVAGILATLIRRRKAMAVTFFGVLFLVIVATLLAPKSYTTEVKLIAGNPSGGMQAAAETNQGANSTLPVLNALLLAGGVQSAATYAELFQETPVAKRVIASLHLNTSPGALLSKISVKPVTDTSILSLSATWSDPQTSALIANAFGKAVVDRERQLVASQATSAISFLTKELPPAEAAMTSAQAALARYEAAHGIADITTQTQTTITQMSNLDAKIGQTDLDNRQAAASLASVQSQLASMSPTISGGGTVAENPVLAQLEQQLATVNVQLATARKQYTDRYPAVIALKDQQQQLQSQIAATKTTVVANTNTVRNPVYDTLRQQAAQYQAQVSATQAELATLKQQRAQLAPALQRLPTLAATLANLQRQATSTQAVYGALQQKYDDATVSRETALSDVTVTQPADAAAAEKRPSLIVNTFVGAILGLILAITAALALDFFDNRVKDQAEAEHKLGLPNLASIPLVSNTPQAPALPWVRTLSVESFLQLVTSLRYASDYPMRTFSITSAGPGEGKSTIAVNLGIAMAEMEPLVLVIDADMRRSSLHAKLHLKNEHGLSDILVGTKSLEEVVQRTRYPGLDIISSGTAPPNPLKLVQSRRMEDLIARALEKYRYVIFDGPALNATLDSAVISRKTDGTLLVVSAGVTDVRAARGALRRLENVGVKNVLGFVMNRVEPRRADYSAYYLTDQLPPSELPVIS